MSGTYTNASQIVAEALVTTNNDVVRASQIAIEALMGSLGYIRASQVVAEALIGTLGFVRVSQVVSEALIDTLGFVRTSQAVSEALISTLGYVRVSQAVLEVLVVTKDLPMPSVYPTLIGLTYNVTKRPIFNTGVGTTQSQNDIVVSYTDTPIWEWDLEYDYLPDFAGAGTTASDLKTLLGFFLSTQGGFMPFCFTDADDNKVVGQSIGVGDGTTTNFTLIRTYGGSDGTGTENIGYLNTSLPYNVYVNGVLQIAGTNYTMITTTPVGQYIKFTSAPAAAATITADFSYYFWVRFAEDKFDFDKFANQFWAVKKLTLRSRRS